MNAVLKSNTSAVQPEVQFEPLTALWLDEVLRVEQSAYSHPWSRANFADSITTGYQMQVLTLANTAAAEKPPILGYFVAMMGFEEVHLLNITVNPAYQQQGWARVMLDALAVWSRGQNAQELWLEVRASNARALKIYKAQGFQMVNLRRDYYPKGPNKNGCEDAVVMSIKL